MSTPTEPTVPDASAPTAELTAPSAVDASANAAEPAVVDTAAAEPAGADPAMPEPAAEPVSAGPDSAEPAAAGMSPAACARELKQRFPALFGESPKPIKLRIQADIQERAPGVFTKKALSIFLHRHTGSTAYLVALSRATQRFDLDGQPAGELAAEHRQAAGEELKRRRAVHEERRALEEAQRHNRAQLLRDFDRTTLTRANFCALKGVADADLDGLLEIARQEAAEWQQRRAVHPPAAPRGRREGPRRDDRPGGAAGKSPPRSGH